eukprot:CAMPEP_0117000366 /NCGR_PEP_ID=MMETSP0472-20121206/2732_1 /TAXON_ID=693140 ORGANISM="Tiarina fusus, Strain LIS" /NCGR_SAMPLE_ID=MMETSP0472 /ASSEMBLY_ACC=CAM_ASM_000603 /LENGTH=335 /DNA_ID=CAMNT_0004700035 /DNA_START=59 /DNA_END=1066 /DNA_ORIENTATION=+
MIMRTAALLSVLALASAAPRQGMTLRRVEQEDGDGEADNDYAWMKDYNLMYGNCFSDDNVATFRLCPAESTCQEGCQNGAEYVTDLAFFIDAFTEAQLGAREYRCEMARENCDVDDDATCYQAANLDYCDDANEDDNGFDLQEYLECVEIGENGYYVGPYCADDSTSIYLGVFEDDDCSKAADLAIFEDEMGFELPYSGVSIVANECARCKEHGDQQDQNGGDDEEDEDDILEQCEQLYEDSNKCETYLGTDDADESGCDYIKELQDSAGVGSSNGASKRSRRRRVWGIIVLLILLAVGGYFIYRFLLKREKEQQKEAKGGVDADNKPSDEKLVT